jgi:hypothetical protein
MWSRSQELRTCYEWLKGGFFGAAEVPGYSATPSA